MLENTVLKWFKTTASTNDYDLAMFKLQKQFRRSYKHSVYHLHRRAFQI